MLNIVMPRKERWREMAESDDEYYVSSPRHYDDRGDRYRPPHGRAPKKWSFGRFVWGIVKTPFKVIGLMTKNLPWLIAFPVRLLLSFAFVGAILAVIMIFIYGTLSNRYDIGEVVKMPERTIVLDRKNREIGRLHGENRVRVKIENVPPILLDAVIVREDSRFYSHSGVDWIGVARAIEQIYRHKRATQGASTITMQLAKITFNHSDRSYNNKLVEVALAKRIESAYSKSEILEAYINRIFWGHTFMGISAAARGYFNKQPSELTVSECAMLAGIIYGPNDNSPYRHPDKAKKVRDLVLKALLDKAKITQQQYDQAIAEPIVTHKPDDNFSEENYAMETIRRELNSILEDENIELGGLIVKTTLDLDLQNEAMSVINKHLASLESRKGYQHPTRKAYLDLPKEKRAEMPPAYLQAAAVVVDNATGAIITLVGGRDAEESNYNRAKQSRRQIGSVFKPFVYAAFFEKGYNGGSLISDDAISRGEIPGAGTWSPRNSDGTYNGMKPASYGLIKSRNTMSVRVGAIAGLTNVVAKARMAGFHGNIFMSPAIFLGTLEASPLDVASAYTVFANGGVRPTPYIIESISDSDKQTLFYTQPSSRRVFTQQAANITSKILEQVTQAGGTAGQTASLGFTAPCGGKTGTTNNYTNAWFAGFTSNLSASVWVGFDKQRPIMNKGYGGVLALPIWVEIMKAAQKEGYTCGPIRTKPTTPTTAILICHKSGKLAHDGCVEAKTAYLETMPGTTPPKELCDIHIPEPIIVDQENNIPEPILADDASPNEDEPMLHTATRIRDFVQDDVEEPVVVDEKATEPPPAPTPKPPSPAGTQPDINKENIPEPIIVEPLPAPTPKPAAPKPAAATPSKPAATTPKPAPTAAKKTTAKPAVKQTTTSKLPAKPTQTKAVTTTQTAAKKTTPVKTTAPAKKTATTNKPPQRRTAPARPQQQQPPRREDYMPNTLF